MMMLVVFATIDLLSFSGWIAVTWCRVIPDGGKKVVRISTSSASNYYTLNDIILKQRPFFSCHY